MALVLDSQARKKIEKLRTKAALFPFPTEVSAAMGRGFDGDDQAESLQLKAILANCTIELEHGYAVTYAIEEQCFGVVRHLAVVERSPGKSPDRTALKLLMEEFGFDRPLGHCIVYPDGPTINIMEPLEPNDEGFRRELSKRTGPILV
jgi:hypothetical protein